MPYITKSLIRWAHRLRRCCLHLHFHHPVTCLHSARLTTCLVVISKKASSPQTHPKANGRQRCSRPCQELPPRQCHRCRCHHAPRSTLPCLLGTDVSELGAAHVPEGPACKHGHVRRCMGGLGVRIYVGYTDAGYMQTPQGDNSRFNGMPRHAWAKGPRPCKCTSSMHVGKLDVGVYLVHFEICGLG